MSNMSGIAPQSLTANASLTPFSDVDWSLYNPDTCTLSTCNMSIASVSYDPTFGGNLVYAIIFGLFLMAQIVLGIKSKMWGYMTALCGGLILETVGYFARVQMSINPFLSNSFLLYLIFLTIAPCFLSAAIYLCLSRIITVYGSHLGRFRPKLYTVIFICCDLLSLVLQAAGGAIADTASPTDTNTSQMGINIMIAGLVCQVVSLVVFFVLSADFALRIRAEGSVRSERYASLSPARLHYFYGALGLACLTIFVRSVFRVAELWGGFHGSLANNEALFMVLEGAMIVTAASCLTFAHPIFIFGKAWGVANPRYQPSKEHSSLSISSA